MILQDVDPPVWRRIEAPDAFTFRGLHEVIQAAMGWQDYHLYEFQLPGKRIGPAADEFDDGDDEVIDATRIRLRDLSLGPGASFSYTYDFGDSWEHRLEVDEVLPEPGGSPRSACLDGARACPPEDCGGPNGYAGLLDALADPHHPEHRELSAWVGGGFDPERFDPALANSLVARVRP